MKEKDQNGREEQKAGEEEPIADEEDEGLHDTQADAGNWYLAKVVKLVVFENSFVWTEWYTRDTVFDSASLYFH